MGLQILDASVAQALTIMQADACRDFDFLHSCLTNEQRIESMYASLRKCEEVVINCWAQVYPWFMYHIHCFNQLLARG